MHYTSPYLDGESLGGEILNNPDDYPVVWFREKPVVLHYSQVLFFPLYYWKTSWRLKVYQ